MAFSLDSVVPWGRSFDEYRRMFALTPTDLTGRILGCADGPASFNAEATEGGCDVVSADPLYAFSRPDIQRRIDATYREVLAQTEQNRAEFVWEEFRSPQELGRRRMAAMSKFLEDYQQGSRTGRYVAAELPCLPFDEKSFDLCVCSHFLFLYADQLSEAFHVSAILELCRVAREVRIFPLLALGGDPSVHVAPVTEILQGLGCEVAIRQVDYEFQKGANHMMRVAAREVRSA